MPLFIVKTKDQPMVRKWFKDTEKRSREDSLIKNPIKWKLKLIEQKKSLLWVCDAEPVIPGFWIFGWVSAGAILFIWGMNPWFWIFSGIGCLGYFWSGDFFYRMSVIALRKKAKYAGPIKRIKQADLIRGVVM